MIDNQISSNPLLISQFRSGMAQVNPRRLFTLLILLGPICLGLIACSSENLPGVATPTLAPSTPGQPPTPAIPQAEITINLEVPPDTPAGEKIYISFLDEVTGLALNALPGEMRRVDETHYTIQTFGPIGSVLKYRYSRNGPLGNLEFSSNSRPVRYRMYQIQGPGVVEDVVSRWQDTPYQWPTGRITGQVTESTSGDPLPNILVTAGGLQTISSSDGTFVLEGLPAGKHNLVAYALDGAYGTFQQEALVAEGSTTPAALTMPARPLVDVSFNVETPPGTTPGVPIKLAGNLAQLGNTFADLEGGMSSLSSRMPVLTALPDGTFSISLMLPAGADIRYKYTQGDGFWNPELNSDGSFLLRQLIVPEEAEAIQDKVESWRGDENAPIWFDVTVPDNTPTGDTISLQLNPYGWTQPISMWRIGENHWAYLLTSPLNLVNTMGYRYCRNDQCGVADDTQTPGDQTGGRPVTTSTQPQTLNDTVDRWELYDPVQGPVTVPAAEIPNRGENFIAGVEIHPGYHPSWESRMPQAFTTISGYHSNWTILTPTWTFSNLAPPALAPIPGEDMLWDTLNDEITQASQSALNVGIRPIPEFPFNPGDWWAAAPRDIDWWDAWFEQYSTFILSHADAAQQAGADLLIIGGPEIAPALAGGVLGDGTPSGVPADADNRWRKLISMIRDRYDGEIGWAMEFTDAIDPLPLFIDLVDQIYILWSAPLAPGTMATPADLSNEVSRLLDTVVHPSLADFDDKIIIAAAYPSAAGAVTGCLTDPIEGDCLTEAELLGPNPPYTNLEADQNEQVEAYNAVLTQVSTRPWVAGFVSRGYYPPVVIQDTSLSINGKLAADVLSYWYARLLGLES